MSKVNLRTFCLAFHGISKFWSEESELLCVETGPVISYQICLGGGGFWFIQREISCNFITTKNEQSEIL